MQMTVLVLLSSMTIAFISDSLSWTIFTSPTWVRTHGPPVPDQNSLPEDVINKLRIKKGLITEITRTFLITIISLVSIALFGPVNIYEAFKNNLTIQIICLVGLTSGLVHYLFIGPYRLAKKSTQPMKLLSQKGFREFFVPYLIKLVGFLAVIFGILGALIISVFIGIQNDLSDLFGKISEINHLLQIQFNDLSYYQIISMQLIGFGDWISQSSQKYIVTSLLLLFFIIFVQSTYLRSVVSETSVDKYKFIFWVIVIAVLSFSVIYLPFQFSNLHEDTQNAIQGISYDLIDNTDLSTGQLADLLALEEFLLSHDINWLILRIFTGYGNIAAAFTILGWAVIKRVFLAEIDANFILALLLPSSLFGRLNNFFAHIGLESLKNDGK